MEWKLQRNKALRVLQSSPLNLDVIAFLKELGVQKSEEEIVSDIKFYLWLFEQEKEFYDESLHEEKDFHKEDFPEKEVRKALNFFVAWENFSSICIKNIHLISPELFFEQRIELECSIFLASKFFYKQALQVLRNFLEITVLHIYFSFSENEQYFREWYKNPDYKTPSFRGYQYDSSGMIDYLKKKSSIDDFLYKKINKIYSRLNNYIHAKRKSLITRFDEESKFKYLQYHRGDLIEWVNTFIKVVSLCLQIYLITDFKRESP